MRRKIDVIEVVGHDHGSVVAAAPDVVDDHDLHGRTCRRADDRCAARRAVGLARAVYRYRGEWVPDDLWYPNKSRGDAYTGR